MIIGVCSGVKVVRLVVEWPTTVDGYSWKFFATDLEVTL
jgi:hypothetical protein